MHHSVPCVGYILKQERKKLLPEYTSKTALEIIRARKKGEKVDCFVTKSIFAYLCDTDSASLDDIFRTDSPPAETVMIECTFIDNITEANDSEIIKKIADSKMHVDWTRLEPIVRRFPQVRFILFHFSQRYSDQQIQDRFCRYRGDIKNVSLWLDCGVFEL